ncbi:MAG: bifunctional oligoribonuclease/PAP phosphatase NrnA [bacterium]
MQLSELRTKILDSPYPIIIITHQNPDGDGIGSQIALGYCLKRLGKEIILVNQDRTPAHFKFLEEYGRIKSTKEIIAPLDKALVLMLDLNDIESAGQEIKEILDSINEKEILFINHHTPKYFESNCSYIVFDSASSTGEIIYRFMTEQLECELDKATAECIYTAIVSDTRSFRYSKTTSYSHQIAADILEYGIQSEKIQLEVFGSNNLSQIHALGTTLENTKISENGKIAYTYIPLEVMIKNKIEPSDTKGFINHLLTIKGVEIAVLVRQDEKEKVKVSIRSKGNYPIYDLAEELGGGGHKFAASFISNMPMDILTKRVIDKLEKLTMEILN